jgi:hypothetical protein
LALCSRAVDESGRKNKLEELLARVRERGSGLHRAVGPADAVAVLDTRLSSTPHPLGSVGPEQPPTRRRTYPGLALDVGSIGPGPLIEDDELEQIASRRSLDRYVEETLGDDEPSVPFPEEGEGWEADALELERSDGTAVGTYFPTEPAAPHSADTAAFEHGVEPEGDSSSFGDAASKLRRRESFDELPPLPLSPFPSVPPPRFAEPDVASTVSLEPFGDLDTTGPQALPLDVPWETLAKQLRGRRRSGEFRIDESNAPTTASSKVPPETEQLETARSLPTPAEAPSADDIRTTELEPTDRAADERAPDAERASSSEAPASDVATPNRPRETEAAASEPPASKPLASRPLSSEPPDAIAGEPSFLRSARRSRRARKERSPAWLPLVGVALLGLIALWWNSGDGARRSPTRASAEPSATPSPSALATPLEPHRAASSAAITERAKASAPPLVTTSTAADPLVAQATIERQASGQASDTPPEEMLGEAEGWLRVRGRRFSVYLNGGLAGATGQWIRTSCGVRHLRLAHVDPPPRGRSFPWWVDEGGPVVVPCRASTTVEVDPGGRR